MHKQKRESHVSPLRCAPGARDKGGGCPILRCRGGSIVWKRRRIRFNSDISIAEAAKGGGRTRTPTCFPSSDRRRTARFNLHRSPVPEAIRRTAWEGLPPPFARCTPRIPWATRMWQQSFIIVTSLAAKDGAPARASRRARCSRIRFARYELLSPSPIRKMRFFPARLAARSAWSACLSSASRVEPSQG